MPTLIFAVVFITAIIFTVDEKPALYVVLSILAAFLLWFAVTDHEILHPFRDRAASHGEMYPCTRGFPYTCPV